MQRLTGKMPSPAMVVAIAALVAALGGGAYAASVAKNSVGAKQLKKNAVVTNKIQNNAVTESKLGPGAVTLSKLAPCPSGAQVNGGVCVDTNARPAQTWQNAVAACQVAGGRLPTTGHLLGLRVAFDLGVVGSTNNWADANFFDGGISNAIAVSDNAGREELVTNGANLRPFRCIYEHVR